MDPIIHCSYRTYIPPSGPKATAILLLLLLQHPIGTYDSKLCMTFLPLPPLIILLQPSFDINAMMSYVDWMNLMSVCERSVIDTIGQTLIRLQYDLHGVW